MEAPPRDLEELVPSTTSSIASFTPTREQGGTLPPTPDTSEPNATLSEAEDLFWPTVIHAAQTAARHKLHGDLGPHSQDDVAQDALERVVRHQDRLREIARENGHRQLSGYVTTTTTNIVTDRLRHHYRKRIDPVGDVENWENAFTSSDTPFSTSLPPDTVRTLQEAGNEDFIHAAYLFGAEGRSYQEIAELLDVSIGTVRSRIHRARELLINNPALQQLAAEYGIGPLASRRS